MMEGAWLRLGALRLWAPAFKALMADVQSDLERQGVCPERIHTETFGPSG
jgi:ferredoxin-NADP reductase